MRKVLSYSMVILFFTSIICFAQNNEMDPTAAQFYNEGNKLLKSGNYQGAIGKYSEALKTSEDHRIYYQLGITYKKLRNYEEAEKSFLASVKSDPKFAAGYNGLGGTYFVSGDYNKAIENFKKFAELSTKASYKSSANENISKCYAKLGESAKADGKYDQAIEYHKQAVSFSNYDASYLALAELYIETSQYDLALEAADKASNFRKSISRGGPFYYKGMAFKGKNEIEKAKENFEAGLKDNQYKSLCKYQLDLMK